MGLAGDLKGTVAVSLTERGLRCYHRTLLGEEYDRVTPELWAIGELTNILLVGQEPTTDGSPQRRYLWSLWKDVEMPYHQLPLSLSFVSQPSGERASLPRLLLRVTDSPSSAFLCRSSLSAVLLIAFISEVVEHNFCFLKAYKVYYTRVADVILLLIGCPVSLLAPLLSGSRLCALRLPMTRL
jgi:hypothetical protein